jgi:hypothetical protein
MADYDVSNNNSLSVAFQLRSIYNSISLAAQKTIQAFPNAKLYHFVGSTTGAYLQGALGNASVSFSCLAKWYISSLRLESHKQFILFMLCLSYIIVLQTTIH